MGNFKKTFVHGFNVYSNSPKSCIRDVNLDIAERGLLLTMLSLPDDWTFSIRGLAAILPSGKGKIQRTLNHLEDAGYLRRTQLKESTGKFATIHYEFADEPIFNHPDDYSALIDRSVEDNEYRAEMSLKDGFEERKSLLDDYNSNNALQNVGKEQDENEIVPCTQNEDTVQKPHPQKPCPQKRDTDNEPQYNTKVLNTNISNINNISTSLTNNTNISKIQKSDEERYVSFLEFCDKQYERQLYLHDYIDEHHDQQYSEVLDIIYKTLKNKHYSIRIRGELWDYKRVKETLLNLTGEDIDCALHKIISCDKKIDNVFSFTMYQLLTARDGQHIYWDKSLNQNTTNVVDFKQTSNFGKKVYHDVLPKWMSEQPNPENQKPASEETRAEVKKLIAELSLGSQIK